MVVCEAAPSAAPPQCGWLGQAVFPPELCLLLWPRASEMHPPQFRGGVYTGARSERNGSRRSGRCSAREFTPIRTRRARPMVLSWLRKAERHHPVYRYSRCSAGLPRSRGHLNPHPGTRVTGGTGLGVVSAPPTQRSSIPGFWFLLLKKKPNRSFSWISNIPTA